MRPFFGFFAKTMVMRGRAFESMQGKEDAPCKGWPAPVLFICQEAYNLINHQTGGTFKWI
jgi:hypothetical protein